jgi:hypothetical protein
MSDWSAEHVPTMKLINYIERKNCLEKHIKHVYIYIHHIRLVHVLRDETTKIKERK